MEPAKSDIIRHNLWNMHLINLSNPRKSSYPNECQIRQVPLYFLISILNPVEFLARESSRDRERRACKFISLRYN